MSGGSITDVTKVVQVEVNIIKGERQNCKDSKRDEVIQVIQQHANGDRNHRFVQRSPDSVSSISSAKEIDGGDIGEHIIARLRLGTGDFGGDDDRDDPGGNGSSNTTDETMAAKEARLCW